MKTTATSNAFDTMVSSLAKDLEDRDIPTDEKPKGANGRRMWDFQIDWIGHDMFDRDDPADFADYIKEASGLGGQTLYYLADPDSSDDGENHTYLVGEVSSDPDACWAVRADLFVPHDTDFQPNASFVGMESGQVIEQLIKQLRNEEIEGKVGAINAAVEAFTGGDNSKLAEMLEAVRSSPGGKWIEGLEAYISRRGMENDTPEGEAGKSGPRM